MSFKKYIILLLIVSNFLILSSAIAKDIHELTLDINMSSLYGQSTILLVQNDTKITTPEDVFVSNKLGKPIKLEARIDVPLKLNLEKAIGIAIKKNLDILGATYERDLSKWKYWENIGNWLPDYSLGLSGTRFDGTFLVGGVFPVMTLTSSVNAFMRFDYRFFEGGKGLFNTLAAKKMYKSSKENLSALFNLVLLQVTKSYNKLLREQAQLDVFAKAVDEARAELELNENLEREGVGTKFDILQSDALLAEQEQLFLDQQSKFRQASIELAHVLNIEQGTHIKPDVADLKTKNLFDFDKPIAEILDIAFGNRPDIKKIELEYKAHRNLIGVAFSDFLPKANFFGQYGGTGNAFFHRTKIRQVTPDAIQLDENGNPVVQNVGRSRILSQTFDPQVDLTNVNSVSNVIRGAGKSFPVAIDDSLMTNKFLGVEVNWGIGDGLGVPTFSRIKQARNQAKITKTNWEKLKLQIEHEVRANYLKVQTAKKLLDVAERRVKSATEALYLAKIRLKNGIGINTELLNAQKQYSEALASRVDAIVGYNDSQAEFLYSLGLITPETLLASNIVK